MPLAVRFFLAFLIVLGLIGATAWAVRRFGNGRLGGAAARGRQPRLAVIEYASVDARRRLILVRRDNVEHLVMTGGPTDFVVEPNIVRAAAAAMAPRPATAAEPLPRAIPLPEHRSWPLQPEPAAPARPAPRIEPTHEEHDAWPLQPQGETPGRPSRDALAAIADELSPPRPAQPRPSRPATAARPQPVEPRAPRAPVVQASADEDIPAEADQNLADMAHRLEAALRKPGAGPQRMQPAAETTPAAETPPAPRGPRSVEPKPRGEGSNKSGQGKALYDSLEQEMASLLGRPTNKT
jgi:hypothetical protein